ncbi:MAG: hypothetical protein LBQ57_10830 [Spirochaetales bacterium]|jgi:hypothetical protein|nr:hypothetical protein [Spirochaetales bacterium]
MDLASGPENNGGTPIKKLFKTKRYAKFVDFCVKARICFVQDVTEDVLAAFSAEYNWSPKTVENIKKLLSGGAGGAKGKGGAASGSNSKKRKEKILSRIPGYNDPVETLPLTRRSVRGLRGAGIDTVEKLLNLDFEALYAIHDLDIKNAAEILACQGRLLASGLREKGPGDQSGAVLLHHSVISLNMSVRSTNALINHGINTVKELLEIKDGDLCAIRNIGKKSIEEIITTKNNLQRTIRGGENAAPSTREDRLRRLRESFERIPQARRGKLVRDYLSCVAGTSNLGPADFRAALDSLHEINEAPSLFEALSRDDETVEGFLPVLDVLAFNAKEFIGGLIKNIFSKKEHDRELEVLRKRCGGKTLQRISDEMSVTRERIRQIENKATRLLVKQLSDLHINLLAFIAVEHGCRCTITVDELSEYLRDPEYLSNAEYLDLFIYTLKTKRIWDDYTFNKRLDIFYDTETVPDIQIVSDLVMGLPDVIEEGQKEALLPEISRENNLPPQLLRVEFPKVYRHVKKVYVRGNLSLARMYSYILEKYYPQGIKLSDEAALERFRNHIGEIFGDISFSEGNRALYARITSLAVLCGRGTYIHPKYISISSGIVNEIDSFIAASPRTVIPFNELFEIFQERLLKGTNVTNRYFLQGILNYYLRDKYFFTRDTVSKDGGADFTDEIEAYIRARGEVHKKELFAEFNGVSRIVFSMRIRNNEKIIYTGNGHYMYTGILNLGQYYYQIKNLLKENVKKNPASSRKILELLKKLCPQFLADNNIETHEKLYGILHFMFKEDFYFSRPYIAKPGSSEISNKTVMREHLKPYDTITIPELVELCKKHRLKYFSIRSLVKSLSDEFLRINIDTLVRITEGIDEAALEETGKLLFEKMNGSGFVVASRIDDYSEFPHIGVEWNSFLLRAVVEKYMDGIIATIDIPVTDSHTMNSVFVDPHLEIENYEALLRMILRTRRPAKVPAGDAAAWLREQGLIIGSPPKFLLDAHFLPGGEPDNPPDTPASGL